jgi:DNA polymerase III delta subunit
MIYFFYGADTKRGREVSKGLFDSLRAKKPDASFVYVDEESFTPGALRELVESQGLFEKKCVALLENISLHKQGEEVLLSLGKELATSPNIFIFFEAEPSKELAKLFLKLAEKSKEFEKKEVKAGPSYTLFPLCDALASRNRKDAWILYREAMGKGVSPDEVHPMFFWQIKNVLLAKTYTGAPDKGPAATGLKPYPYQKAKNAGKYWQEEELRNLAYRLVDVYHQARSGEEDFEIGLERVLISL